MLQALAPHDDFGMYHHPLHLQMHLMELLLKVIFLTHYIICVFESNTIIKFSFFTKQRQKKNNVSYSIETKLNEWTIRIDHNELTLSGINNTSANL